jgi:hypothetical protein
MTTTTEPGSVIKEIVREGARGAATGSHLCVALAEAPRCGGPQFACSGASSAACRPTETGADSEPLCIIKWSCGVSFEGGAMTVGLAGTFLVRLVDNH